MLKTLRITHIQKYTFITTQVITVYRVLSSVIHSGNHFRKPKFVKFYNGLDFLEDDFKYQHYLF